jgi:hypothetical protein
MSAEGFVQRQGGHFQRFFQRTQVRERMRPFVAEQLIISLTKPGNLFGNISKAAEKIYCALLRFSYVRHFVKNISDATPR